MKYFPIPKHFNKKERHRNKAVMRTHDRRAMIMYVIVCCVRGDDELHPITSPIHSEAARIHLSQYFFIGPSTPASAEAITTVTDGDRTQQQ